MDFWKHRVLIRDGDVEGDCVSSSILRHRVLFDQIHPNTAILYSTPKSLLKRAFEATSTVHTSHPSVLWVSWQRWTKNEMTIFISKTGLGRVRDSFLFFEIFRYQDIPCCSCIRKKDQGQDEVRYFVFSFFWPKSRTRKNSKIRRRDSTVHCIVRKSGCDEEPKNGIESRRELCTPLFIRFGFVHTKSGGWREKY